MRQADHHQLPDTFLIGAQKAGTSWLHDVCVSHPAIYAHPTIKELNYFWRKHYDRLPLSWYASHFPHADQTQYRAIIDTGPGYLFVPGVADRICSLIERPRCIILLRDPVTRLISEYRHVCQKNGETRDMQTWARQDPEALAKGTYATQLREWFARVPRDRCLIMIAEEVQHEPGALCTQLGRFLSVSPDRFDENVARTPIHRSRAARFPRLTRQLMRVRRTLKHHRLEAIPSLITTLGGKRLLFETDPPDAPISPEDHQWLTGYYKQTVQETERILGRSIPAWHSSEERSY